MTRPARGSVVPFFAASFVLVALLAVVLSVIGGAAVVSRRTDAAADLVALAGATALQHGRDACRAADRSASLNDVTVMVCEIQGQAVWVEVSRLAPRMFGRDLIVRASARAGPE
ncbi:MAG TPA: Rv3654c family TadE-like protein [Nocardioidaceae bacterium]|nr:Rv3654c family TadE-like protein [Nocardioidaceae bacterium]